MCIMRVSQNVSIRWKMNFYDKNTLGKGKEISEKNEFSQNTPLTPFYRHPESKVFFRSIFDRE
jgi:hypothetical protein